MTRGQVIDSHLSQPPLVHGAAEGRDGHDIDMALDEGERSDMTEIVHVGAMTPVLSFADLEATVRGSLAPWNQAPGEEPRPVSVRVTQQLLNETSAERLQKLLRSHGLRLAGFSAVGIGGGIKEHVHTPDWRTEERLAVMFAAANMAAELAQPGDEFSITTSALSYRDWIDTDMPGNWAALTLNLIRVVQHLVMVRERTGVTIHLDLELEPGSLLRDSSDAVWYVQEWLLSRGAAMLSDRMPITDGTAAEAILRHVRIALDTAHMAVVDDEAATALQRLDSVGMRIGRLQVSAALEIEIPDDPILRRDVVNHLQQLVSDRLLQQVFAVRDGVVVGRYADLPDALAVAEEAGGETWRIHTHAPLLADRYGLYRATRAETAAWLRAIAGRDVGLIELRSANVAVVPADDRGSMAEMIALESAWVRSVLAEAGLRG